MNLSIYRNGTVNVTPHITENTTLTRELMGEDFVLLEENYTQPLDVAIGDYITVDSRNYYVNTPPEITKNNERDFDHRIEFQALHYDLAKVQFLNTDNQSDFFFNGKLTDFIDLIVTNMNRVFAGWSSGTVTATYKDEYRNLHFQAESCYAVLKRLATEYDAEYNFSTKAINMVDEIGSASGETFSYKSGLRDIEKEYGGSDIITRLYAFGSEKNIPPSYRNGATRLEFSDGGNKYLEKNTGTYGTIEKVKIFEEVYPHRTGSLSSVASSNVIADANMTFNLNSYLLPGIKPKFHAESGDLAGIEFEIESFTAGGHTFTLIPYEDEHLKTMPNNTLQFVAGDEYILTDCEMPTTYVTQAESLLKAKAQDYLDDYAEPDLAYKITLDPTYIDDNSITLSLGDEINVIDTDLNVSIITRISKIEYPLIDDTYLTADVSNIVHAGAISRLNNETEKNKRDGDISKTGDIPERRWGWWTQRGPNTGRTWATDSGMPGHYQRILIDGENNRLVFYNDDNSVALKIDDTIYGAYPGIKLNDGAYYNRQDDDNKTWSLSNYFNVNANEAEYRGPLANIKFASAASSKGQVFQVINAQSNIITGSDGQIGVNVGIDGTSSGDAYGIFSEVGANLTGNKYSGFFKGGNFLVRLGDTAGSNEVIIQSANSTTVAKINSNGDLELEGDLALAGRFSWEPAKRITFNNNAIFPCGMPLYRNEEYDNTLSQADGTEILANTIDTINNVITLSHMPYVESIWNPGTDEKWGLINLDTHATGDPATSGDYADLLLIDSGTYTARTISYTVKRGADTNFTAGDKVALYNPYRQPLTFYDSNPVIEEGAATWRDEHVTPAGGFIHSDGSLIMLVNGKGVASGEVEIGAFKSDGDDWSSFSVLNSDSSIFTKGGTSWRQNSIGGRGSCFKLPNEDRYILYCDGKDSSNNHHIGYVKFDEDFSADSIEYASAAIIANGTSTSGLSHPCVTFHDGRFRMAYRDRKTGTLTDTEIGEAFSETPEGPFDGKTSIIDCSAYNNSHYVSSHASPLGYFIWMGRLCLIVLGTSQYSYSGVKANNVAGIWYHDDTITTPDWKCDSRSPNLINPFYCDEVWGKDDWMEDHFGNFGTPIMHPTDGYLYIPFSATSGTDNYKIGFFRLDVQNLEE